MYSQTEGSSPRPSGERTTRVSTCDGGAARPGRDPFEALRRDRGGCKLVVKTGGVAEEIGRALRSLFDQRSVADYGDEPVSGEQAEAALEKASKIVAAVDHWLSEQGR